MTGQKSESPRLVTDPIQNPQRAAAKRIDRVNKWLHLGGALSSEEYARFREAGITHVVDLREAIPLDGDGLEQLGIARRHVPVPDGGPPRTEQLSEVAGWLAEQGQGARIYVHCKGGFGRAATMAVGLLVLRGIALNDAVEQVRTVRPEIRLNAEQLAWLHTVEDEVSERDHKGL